MAYLQLPDVTLCAASDVALEATLRAMEASIEKAAFGSALLFSSKQLPRPPKDPSIQHVSIAPLNSREAYSRFVLSDLAQYIESAFVLIVQWDGFIINPAAWDESFLDFDFIGAPWTHFDPPFNIGNGGFSLRSRRLLQAGSQSWFNIYHPEDLCICRGNREALESRGFRFPDSTVARRFAREREAPLGEPFGIHGIFALAEVLSEQQFEIFLSYIESGVIGRRELTDTLITLREIGGNRLARRRCARELISRFPFSKKSFQFIREIF